MISLSDQQLKHLMTGAAMVSPSDRDPFLRSVAAQLIRHPVSDGDLAAAISFVLEGRGISVKPTLFLHEGDFHAKKANQR